MSKETKIHWTDGTVNPTMGCSGCELYSSAAPQEGRCYAAQYHARRKTHPGFSPDFNIVKLFPGRTAEAAKWADLAGTRRAEKPWLDGMPRLIFVSDMGDALSEGAVMDKNCNPLPMGVSFQFLKAEIVDVVTSDRGRRHVWLWLTKRSQRMLEFAAWLRDQHGIGWPANLWPGTSVTTQASTVRLDSLLEIGGPDTTRFVSVEPQIEAVSLTKWLQTGHLHWVINGGESKQGPPAMEFKLEWARDLRDECSAHHVAFFLKQLGSCPTQNGTAYKTSTSHGEKMEEWPSDIRIREMPLARTPNAIDVSDSGQSGQRAVVLSDQHPAGACRPESIASGTWTQEHCTAWAKGAKPHVRDAIRVLARGVPKTTVELNASSGCTSGGAIIGGLNAWATRRGLPFPVVRRCENGSDGYRFMSDAVRRLFEAVLVA